jgi:hypothetical protein
MSLTIELAVGPVEALYLEDLLADHGVTAERSDENPVRDRITGAEGLIVMSVLVGGAKTVELVVDIVYRMRQRFRPMIVLDLTQDEPKLTILKEAPGLAGELIIKTREGEEITQVHGASQSDTMDFIKSLMA